ncbi:hypothetical protein GCM10011575_38060 [Microlunatus endophyticus]|uniref:Uncharacterized protein n=1 Tax=Microlunatus endophyticus TaxID=1716077 RepID=A0A917W6L2_9ACTN|nr:hypothetical protein GCM10011575_38060 [Microlunatus endophyticus]
MQVGKAGTEIAFDVGECDGHDRDVEQQHEGRGADNAETQSFDGRHGPSDLEILGEVYLATSRVQTLKRAYVWLSVTLENRFEGLRQRVGDGAG